MNKRILYMLIGFILIVISAYLLHDIITALPESSSTEPEFGSMPDTTGDWYLTKVFGILLLASAGLGLAIINIIRLFNGKKKDE